MYTVSAVYVAGILCINDKISLASYSLIFHFSPQDLWIFSKQNKEYMFVIKL